MDHSQDDAHVVTRDLSKFYGGALAVNNVSVVVPRSKIMGIVGENGAGKSTLCKIIGGAVPRDRGELLVNDRVVSYRSPADALHDGIAMIAQEVALVPKLSVLANVFLSNESRRYGMISRSQMLERYEELESRVGFGIPPGVLVEQLALSDQQKVEILRALARNSELLILDEPTASLGHDESAKLYESVTQLSSRGTTVLLISHNLEDVLTYCQEIAVMRDGQLVRQGDAKQETQASLIEGMLGRPMDAVFPAKSTRRSEGSSAALSVRSLTRPGAFTDVSFELHPGEIVALAGLVGAGRSEVARAIFGLDRHSAGEVVVDGQSIHALSPRSATDSGMALIPESRRDQGLVLCRPVEENINLVTLSTQARFGALSMKRLRASSAHMIKQLAIRGSNLSAAVEKLSGGNQQKVLFAKWLMTKPSILIADEPTRGVDIGAKKAIYELLVQLAADGVAVLLISSELEEVVGLSHRVLVMRQGKIVAHLVGDEIDASSITRAAFGELVGEVS